MSLNKKLTRFTGKKVQPITKSDIFVSLYATAPFDYPARCYNNYIGFTALKITRQQPYFKSENPIHQQHRPYSNDQ